MGRRGHRVVPLGRRVDPGLRLRPDKFSQLIPAATVAIVLAHFIATVFSAALLVVITSDGGGGKDTALKTGESHTLLARASRLGYPLRRRVASLGAGAASCVGVASCVESLSVSNLANAIIDPAAPAFRSDAERLAAYVAVAAGALAAFRLLARRGSARGGTRPSGVTVRVAAHNDHSVSRDAFVLLACTIASHRRRFLATMALASVAHVHAGAQSLREFARAASGFSSPARRHGDSRSRSKIGSSLATSDGGFGVFYNPSCPTAPSITCRSSRSPPASPGRVTRCSRGLTEGGVRHREGRRRIVLRQSRGGADDRGAARVLGPCSTATSRSPCSSPARRRRRRPT